MKNSKKNIKMLLFCLFIVLGFSGCGNKEGIEREIISVKNDKSSEIDLSLKQGINKNVEDGLEVDTSEWGECKDYENGTTLRAPWRWCSIENNKYKFLTQQFFNKVWLYGDLNIDKDNEFDYSDCEIEKIEEEEVFYDCKNEKKDEIIIGKRIYDVNYIFTWKIESSQKPIETDLDIWYPEIKFSVLDLREIVKSLSSLKMERDEKFSEELYLLVEGMLKNRNSKVDVSLYKIFNEVKNPFNKNVSAILFGLDSVKNELDKCCSKPTGIMINNNGEIGEKFIQSGALNSQYIDNVIWESEEILSFDSVLANVGGVFPKNKTLLLK